jgi:hypothetical protein
MQNPWRLRDIHEYRAGATQAKESIASANENISNLRHVRSEVKISIEEQRAELIENVRQEENLMKAIDRATKQETGLRFDRGQELQPPEFSPQELKRLELNSITLRDSQMLGTAQGAMEVHSGHISGSQSTIASRALGRAEAVDVSLREIAQRIQNFTETHDFFPVIFKTADGNDRTATLQDFQPRTLKEKVFGYFSPADRFNMNAINGALDQHYADLVSEQESLERFASAARDLEKSYEQSLLMSLPEGGCDGQRQITMPEFTAREVAQVETFAAQQSDAGIRAQFETIVHSTITGSQINDLTSSSVEDWDRSQIREVAPAETQLSKDDFLNSAKELISRSVKESSELGTLNEAAMTAETDTASELLVAIL